MNTLQQLITQYPDKDWNRHRLAYNRCITLEFVTVNRKFFELGEFLYFLHRDTYKSKESTLIELVNNKWLIEYTKIVLLTNGLFTIEEYIELIHDDKYKKYLPILNDTHKFKYNERITDINPTNKYGLEYCPSILNRVPWSIISKSLYTLDKSKLQCIYANPSVTLDIIEKDELIRYNIDFDHLAENDNITMQFVLLNKDKFTSIGWYRLTINHSISLDDIADNLNLPWQDNIVKRYDLTLSFIKYLVTYSKDYKSILTNPIRRIKLLSNPSFKYNELLQLCELLDIDINSFKAKTNMIMNPMLTLDDIKIITDIDWNLISSNEFELYPSYDKAIKMKDKRKKECGILFKELYNTILLHINVLHIIIEYVMFT